MNRSLRKFDFRGWLAAAVLVFVVVLVYGRLLGYGFLAWDDGLHVTNNRELNPVTWHSVGHFWTEPYWGLYIPLSYTFFAAEALLARWLALSGGESALNPMVFHAGNVLLHVACVLMVFVILRRLVRHDGAAAAGALLFGVHPVQVESVAWVSETRGLLCAWFSLVAIWQYLGYARASSRRRAVAHYAAAAVAFLAALLCKPAAVAVPLLLGVLEFGLLRRSARQTLVGLAPWLIVALGFSVLTKRLQPDLMLPSVPWLGARLLVAGDGLAFYLSRLVAPLGCAPDYGRTPQWVMQHWWFYIAWIVPTAFVAALACLRNRRVGLVACGLFVGWLVPVLGLVPFDFQRISTVADRYLYLALLGPALGVSWLLARWWNRYVVLGASTVLTVLAVLSAAQTRPWRNDIALWVHTLEVNPNSVIALHNYGYMLSERGRENPDHPWFFRRAIPWFDQALGVDPRHAESYLNRGIAWFALGEVEAARRDLRQARDLRKDWPAAHYALGCVAALGERDLAGAEQHFRRTIELDPEYVQARVNLARVLENQDRFVEAIETYREALARTPPNSTAASEIRRLLGACRRRKPDAQ